MKRLIENTLLEWKDKQRRKPLIIRGARQTGKTYTVSDFANRYFDNFITADFERNPEYSRIFEPDLDPRRIINDLEIVSGRRIIPARTLIFFDEIQECPRALLSLRYFYEELPEMYLIAAGSLLEFAMGEISFPVGRVQFADLYPLNFIEFQMALGNEKAVEVLSGSPKKISESSHKFLLNQLKDYFFVGGMPEAVKTFTETGSVNSAIEVQGEICDSLRQDFAKYNPQVNRQCLSEVFTSLAKNTGKQTKYASLSEGYTNPTIKKAYQTLVMARLANKINSINPQGLPLSIMTSKVFKSSMLDIGIMNYLCGIYKTDEYFNPDLLGIYRGAMAEQFVAQEFIGNQGNELFYWSRQAKSSSAEVDFVISSGNKIIPVEVKSAKAGKLRSMHLFLKEYPKWNQGYVFSMHNYSELKDQKLTFIPIYFAWSASR